MVCERLNLTLLLAALIPNLLVAERALSDSKGRAVPEWARQSTLSLRGNLMTIVCTGRGPSVDQARAYAMRNCRNAAADTLQDQYSVRGITIESDKSVGFHQEVETKSAFTGLKCNPVKDEISSADGLLYDIWLKCEFDLTKVQRGNPATDTSPQNEEPDDSSESIPTQRNALVHQREVEINTDDPHDTHFNSIGVIDIVSIPTCDKVLVQGVKSRSVSCSDTGVTSLTISTDDNALVIQRTGYLSKTFKVPKKIERHQTIQVILEPSH